MPKITKKVKPQLYGRVHKIVYERNGCLETKIRDDITDNLIVDVGKDTILKYLGNITGGFQFEKIGVGDSASAAGAGDTALLGASQLILTISSADRVYSRPTLFISVEFGYTQANFTWNEIGLFDATTPTEVLVARQVDATPLIKTSTKRAIVEWQISL